MSKRNPKKKWWQVLGVILVIILALILVSFVVVASVIGRNVDEKCEQAMSKYEGDCVEAMMVLVANESENFEERNHGIWVLGQMGDERAVSILQSLYTGEMPTREPYAEGISQYELQKALALIDSGFNLTALVWR